jgi:hypothetical protein
MSSKVFISYSNHDVEVAYRVCDFLERHGVKCWVAPRDVPKDVNYPKAIINAIENTSIFILIFSLNTVKSDHVITETLSAFNRKIPVIAFRTAEITPTGDLEYLLATKTWLDAFRGDFESHCMDLVNLIKKVNDTGEETLVPASSPSPEQKLNKSSPQRCSQSGETTLRSANHSAGNQSPSSDNNSFPNNILKIGIILLTLFGPSLLIFLYFLHNNPDNANILIKSAESSLLSVPIGPEILFIVVAMIFLFQAAMSVLALNRHLTDNDFRNDTSFLKAILAGTEMFKSFFRIFFFMLLKFLPLLIASSFACFIMATFVYKYIKPSLILLIVMMSCGFMHIMICMWLIFLKHYFGNPQEK